MFRRRRTVRAYAGLLVLLSTVTVSAAPPPSLGSVVQTDRPLSSADQQNVQQYVQYWADQLGDDASSAAEAAEGAQKLIEPPSTNIASPIFLSAYGREALPRLQGILEQDNHFAAVQAARVAGFLGTPDAMEALLPWCDSTHEPRKAVRLWASRSCEILIRRTLKDGVVNERQLAGTLRQLKQAAENEDDWLVLHRQLEAMVAVDSVAARQRQLEVFSSVLRRLERSPTEPSPLMQSLTRAMVSFRQQYLRLSNLQEQTEFGSALAPILGNVHKLADVHWDAAQQQPKTRQQYGQAIQLSEGLLKFIDQSVRAGPSSPRTDLSSAWNNGDQQAFQADMQSWLNVLKDPPYTR